MSMTLAKHEVMVDLHSSTPTSFLLLPVTDFPAICWQPQGLREQGASCRICCKYSSVVHSQRNYVVYICATYILYVCATYMTISDCGNIIFVPHIYYACIFVPQWLCDDAAAAIAWGNGVGIQLWRDQTCLSCWLAEACKVLLLLLLCT